MQCLFPVKVALWGFQLQPLTQFLSVSAALTFVTVYTSLCMQQDTKNNQLNYPVLCLVFRMETARASLAR
jgi:hypothetical protein